MNTGKLGKMALMCAASVVALAATAQAQSENVEQVTVTGSRVISDITLSPTPITVVATEQLQATTPMWGGSSSLYFNIQNIGNTRAPLVGANPSVPGLFYPSPTQYSDMGRYFTIGLKGNF